MNLFLDMFELAPTLLKGLSGNGGLLLNLGIAATSIPLSIFIGACLGSLRSMGITPLSQAIAAFTEIVKSVPVILLIFWLHYSLPVFFGLHPPLFVTAVTALTIFGCANCAEVVRSGLNAVSQTEIESARLAGLSRIQIARNIVIPQAISSMLPALISVAITLFKDTSLAFVIGLLEITQTGIVVIGRFPERIVPVYILIALGYLVVCLILSWCAEILRQRHPQRIAIDD